ncbi:hypothetical protein COV19_02245 [Candidatus Woesearchaeota archaeon CG10_big_fil_rev_8_21_14_0_10_44_13]|nr:MAG: hypothetical protein COV19_02245 [Candidatus Woesearchaeota archaeon CG10_big_fil_rev_8_21_14_0_10_44_13]
MTAVQDTKSAVCYQCNKMVPVSDLRFVLAEKDTAVPLCSECRSKTRTKVHVMKKVEEGREAKTPVNRPDYYCERCKYRFKHDSKGKTNLRCPFCGKSDKIRQHKEHAADDLLKESEGYY